MMHSKDVEKPFLLGVTQEWAFFLQAVLSFSFSLILTNCSGAFSRLFNNTDKTKANILRSALQGQIVLDGSLCILRLLSVLEKQTALWKCS
eukprot:1080297-Amphidinium_carterae.1